MSSSNQPSRRKFLKTATTAAVGTSILASAGPSFGFHNGVNDTLRIGLVGCGGRGTGAIINALTADPNTQVTALADAFPDRIDLCIKSLAGSKDVQGRINVPPEHQFTGFDCCNNLVQANVDVVLLAAPPYFRPEHLKAAVAAGKHVFCEKPVGVDAPGVRSVMETCKEAEKKGLSIVSGLCWRYDNGVNAVMDQIKSGAIGDIKTIQENYLTGTLWHRGSNPDWSQMEYQMRNWLYFTWLSGDHIAEQHIHSLDKALWLMGDRPPAKAYGCGGRLVRTNEKWGNIYDHFATVFEWDNGVKTFSCCRQMAGCFNDVEDYVVGTTGAAKILKNEIYNDKGDVAWKFEGDKPSMYDIEHQHLFRSIREGKPINNGTYMSYSTLMAILGRQASYTGQEIKWGDMMASDQKLGPKQLTWGDYEPDKVAKPGDGAW